MLKVLVQFKNKFLKRKFEYEEPLFSILKKVLPPNPVILESGAHNGYDTARLATFWPKATIHAFEPNPNVFAKLKREVRYRNNIKIYSEALNQEVKIQDFHISAGKSDSSSSLLTPKEYLDHPEIVFSETIKVSAITLDFWSEREKIPLIDFMWLDMQGAEYPALIGGTKILPNVKAIYSEINFRENYEGNILYPEYKKFLESKNFVEVFTDIKFNDSGNALFLRKDIALQNQ